MTDVYQKACGVPTLERVIDTLEESKKGAPVEYVHGLRAALHLVRGMRTLAIEANNFNDVLNAIAEGDIDSLLPEAPASVVAGMKLPEAAKAVGIDLDGVLADIERDAMDARNRRRRAYEPPPAAVTFPNVPNAPQPYTMPVAHKGTLQHGSNPPAFGSGNPNVVITNAGGALTISAPGVSDSSDDGAGQAPGPELEDARDPETVVDGIEFASPEKAKAYRFGEHAADVISKIAPYPYRSHTR
ncbi:RNA polymerase [Burkholderia phage BcepSauron]|uniref:RNA polymerase n=1 Tax=Burkholderia phage BcepSauron TaxID=2530033 RepID=A0A482MKC3_9CAUD|nr:RNA polymerase [Burkholderia phage BcepSauron]QBQ74481.1 RNA polymerase [Burkholderia phage BcepSauron]